MAVFELVLALLFGGVGLALLAPRLGVPWPALLALAGAALAFVPGVPEVALDPELALALFVAPVLLDAAYDASPRDLRANWRPVANLVLVAVGLTVAGVAATAHWLQPGLPWAAAIALGAIVAPPDAAAAAAVLRQVRLPHRMMVILEGESLLNDASALLIYRLAIGAAAGDASAWDGPLVVLGAVGGAVLGVVLARAYIEVIARVREVAASVVLQFLGTFGVWLLAAALGLSPVLTMVAYAVTLARLVPSRSNARARRASYAVWEVAVFVLNVLAFILIGLQLRSILGRLGGQLPHFAGFAAAVLAATVLIRIAWVMSYSLAVKWRQRWFWSDEAAPSLLPTQQGALVISWCGMRGIVTLAAALALPDGFPERDLILFTAFCVVLGTLVLQGMTLRPLLARIALPHDASVDQEVELARQETARAALDVLGAAADSEARTVLKRHYKARLADDAEWDVDATGMAELRRRTLAAERQCLLTLRRERRIGDAAFHRVEEDLDWAEADAENPGSSLDVAGGPV